MTDDLGDELRFIVDAPASEDFFKSHAPLARAIAESIINNSGLKVIGLLGRWGSGKSTIVLEIEAFLKRKRPEYVLINYDAWLHQSDPLRRSFLESVARHLWQQEPVDKEKWEKCLKRLSGETVITEEEKTPVVTKQAKLFFILAFLFSFGLFLAKDTFKEAFNDDNDYINLWGLRVSLLLMTATSFFWVARYYYEKFFGTPESFLPTVLMNKEPSKFEIITNKTIEPTSIEFGRYFRDLMKEASTKDRRIVIAIDNIDRIGESEAIQTWANIRSMFLSEKDEDQLETEQYHPVVILPVDAGSLSQIFSVGSDLDAGHRLARSFINKTFDVTFEVPVPVMSDWKMYLQHKMKEVLGSHYDESKYFWTKRFIEDWFDEEGVSITPREINKLLNSIVALLLQWGFDDVRFEVTAYFSVNRRKIDADLLKALSVPDHPLAKLVRDWQKQLAALHYGVAVEHAAQVLMTQPLQQAIVSGDEGLIAPYRAVGGYGDTFEAVTANLPFDDRDTDFEIITNAARLLSVEDDDGAVWRATAWKNLIRAFNSVLAFAEVPDLAERVGYLKDHIDRNDASDFLLTIEHLGDQLLSQDEVEAASIRQFGEVGAQALDVAKRFELETPKFSLSGDAARYLSRLTIIRAHRPVQRRIQSRASHEDLVAALVTRLADETLAPSVPALWALLTSRDAEFAIKQPLQGGEQVIASAENLARSHSGQTNVFQSAVLTLQLSMPYQEAGRSTVERLVADSTFTSQIGNVAGAEATPTLAVMLAALVWKQVNIQSPFGQNWSELIAEQPTILLETNKVLDWLCGKTEAQIDILLETYDRCPDMRAFVSALFENRIERGSLGGVHPEKALTDLWRYSRMLNRWGFRSKLASLLTGYSKFAEAVSSSPWAPGIAEAASLLKDDGSDAATKFKNNMLTKVKDAPEADWVAAVKGTSELFKIATQHFDRDTLKMGIDTELLRALSSTAKSGALFGKQNQTRWFDLAEMLTTPARKRAFEDAKVALSTRPPAEMLRFLKAGGSKFLAESKLFKDHELAVTKVVIPLARSAKGRNWLRDRRSELRAVFAQASPEIRQKMQIAVDSAAKSGEPDARHWATMVKSELGFG